MNQPLQTALAGGDGYAVEHFLDTVRALPLMPDRFAAFAEAVAAAQKVVDEALDDAACPHSIGMALLMHEGAVQGMFETAYELPPAQRSAAFTALLPYARLYAQWYPIDFGPHGGFDFVGVVEAGMRDGENAVKPAPRARPRFKAPAL